MSSISYPDRWTNDLKVFMTRKDLACVHEPFGDAFYYGPERMSTRFEGDPETRDGSGFSDSTYKTIFDRLEQEGEEGKRIFIKDILHYLVPPDAKPAKIAPSLHIKKRGIGTDGANGINGVNGVHGVNGGNGMNGDHVKKLPFPYDTEGEDDNPSVVPRSMLEKFHFTFLIRDPHSSIPSYYRCTIPPLVEMTGFYDFYPNEAGYDELRRFFDYMRHSGQVGPSLAGAAGDHNGANGITNGTGFNGSMGAVETCIVDADDLLDDPEGIIKVYCKSVGLDYTPDMLNWDNEEDHVKAKTAFEKWKGFHEDAIESKDLKARTHKKHARSEDEWDTEWREKYGDEAAKLIRQTVDANMEDYLHLKQYAIKL